MSTKRKTASEDTTRVEDGIRYQAKQRVDNKNFEWKQSESASKNFVSGIKRQGGAIEDLDNADYKSKSESMSIAVPATASLNIGGQSRKRNYGGGYYKKQYYKLKKYKARVQQRAKKQKEQFKNVPWNDAEIRAKFGESYAKATPQQKAFRELHNFYGKGDYKTWLSHLSKGMGAVAGGAIGYMGGGLEGLVSGAQSGFGQGAHFAKFMGWGDYGTSMNQIMGGSNKGQMSVNDENMTGDVYITQTEFVQNVSCSAAAAGASAFQITAFAINPGLSAVFPFLSQIAQNYTLYEFEGLIFKFNPTSGENNATSNSLGKVILATQYDPDAPNFINSVQMENYDYANAAKPSCSIYHGVETDNSQQAINMQYVRTGASTKSKIFTDIGTFYIATEGIPFAAAGTQILGELWVTYRIKLSRANLYGSLLGQNITQDVLGGTSSAAALTTGTTFVKSTNQIGVTVFPNNSQSFTIAFPPNISLGTYNVEVEFNSGATVFTTQTGGGITSCVNCAGGITGVSLATSPNFTPSVAPLAPVGTTSNTRILIDFFVTVQAPGNLIASLLVNVLAVLTNTTTWRVRVTQINQTPTLTLT